MTRPIWTAARADSAGGPVHEERLAGRQPCLAPDGVVSGDEGLRHRRRLAVVQPVGDSGEAALVHEHAVGQPAAADEPEDAGALLPRAHALAAGLHDAGDLEAGDVRRAPRGSRVGAGPLDEVGGVERGERRSDDDLLPARHRIRPLLEPDDLVATRPGEDDRPHAASSRRRARLGPSRAALVGDVGPVVEAFDGQEEGSLPHSATERFEQSRAGRPRLPPDSGTGPRSRGGGSRRRWESSERRSP